jgi:hypothetical protein
MKSLRSWMSGRELNAEFLTIFAIVVFLLVPLFVPNLIIAIVCLVFLLIVIFTSVPVLTWIETERKIRAFRKEIDEYEKSIQEKDTNT